MRSSRKRAERIAICGMLLALMLVLGFVESQLPVAAGIPGVKLGLSNGVLIFAVYMFNIPTAFLLMVLKVLLSGMMFGNPSAMMYAFAGGALSLTLMVLLSRMKDISPVVVSMVGGLSHNVGQVLLAMVILGTPKLVYYMAVLMVVGMVTGLATGVAANGIIRRFRKENKLQKI